MLNTVPDTTNANPIFSSYNLQSADFNENMDEFVKAPNDLYIEEQKKKINEKSLSDISKKNINKQAIENIPEYPEWLNEDFGNSDDTPEWFKNLDIATEADIEEWKSKGKMGFVETLQRHNYWYGVPYAGTSAETTMMVRNANTLRKIKNGENVSDVDLELLSNFLRDAKEIEVRGGHTWLGGAGNILLNSAPYAAEFLLGIAAIGADGVGFAALGKTLATIGAKKAARKAVEAALKEAAIKSAAPNAVKNTLSLSAAKKIYKDTLKNTTMSKALTNISAKELGKETLKNTPKAIGSTLNAGKYFMPQQFAGGIADRQLSTGVYITDAGDNVFKDSENLALSIYKAFGDTTFDALTETMGWSIAPVASYFAKPVRKIMPKSFFDGFEKLVSSRYGMPASEALRKYGYDGVIEEMGEEALSRLLSQTFGMNGLDEYNFDGFMKNIFYFDKEGKSGIEGFKTGLKNSAYGFSQEALSFGAMSGSGHIIAGTSSKTADIWKDKQYKKDINALTNKANEYISSPEQFYLDQGFIKIKGSQSAAEQKLREIWTAKNIDEGLQNDVLKNMSETEIRENLKKSIEEENQDAGVRRNKAVDFLADTLMKNKQGYKNKDKALQNADLIVTGLEKFSEATGKSIEELIREEAPEIRNQSEYLEGRVENNRIIDNRLAELEQEFENLTEEDYQEGGKFETLEAEYNELVNRKNQGETYYQDANIAGAEDGEYLEAAKEWKEKGTDSKYFKKWSGDTPVVKADNANNYEFKTGEGVTVEGFHGTTNYETKKTWNSEHGWYDTEYKEFEVFKNTIPNQVGHFFVNNEDNAGGYGDRVYHTYINMKNPLVIDCNNQDYSEITFDGKTFDTYGWAKFAKRSGYDGVIFTNIIDGADYGDLETSNTEYVPFSSKQIKSVDNRGTFDAENPNIYYQTDVDEINNSEKYKNLPENLKEAIDYIFNGQPVYNVTGEEFPDNGEDIIERVNKFYNDNSYTVINIDDFGYIYLDKKGIKDSLAHGKGNNKINAFASVPNVIKNGKRIDITKNNNKNENRYLFVAPISIKDKPYFCEVIVREPYSTKNGEKEIGKRRFYIHEVEVIEKLSDVFSRTFQQGTSESSKSIIADLINKLNPSVNKHEENNNDKNLIMTHSARIENLDAIIETGSLIAPSMAITNKNQETLNNLGFGEVIFVRNPDKIDFRNDNIYDRDIYSPRMPRPVYRTHNGYNDTIDSYEYDAMERLWKNQPEIFKQKYYGMTFDEYFKNAEKVLWQGYTPSGKRKYAPYNATNIIKEMKKQGLQNGEMWGYGLSSFLATLAKKQSNMKQLKKSSVELGKVEKEVMQELKEKYSNIEDDLRTYAKEDYKSYSMFTDIYPEVLYAISTNNTSKLNEYMDVQELQKSDAELLKDVKDFIATALTANRTYFEAKPMREVPIDEFSAVLVSDGVTVEQKAKLKDLGLEVVEYKTGKISEALNEFKNKNIFFQFAGENSETSDKHSLMNAKKMLAKGENPEYVRKLTGWFKGVDGKFRYEISDKDALVNVESIKKARQDEIDYIKLNIKDYNTRMSDLVDRHEAKEIDDKDFREQYDNLMSRKLEEVDALKYYEAKGYASRLYEILDHEKLYAAYPSLRFVRVEFRPHSYGVMGSYSNSMNEISLDLTLLYGKEDELKETLMHEIQHFIQHKEDFAVGGNVQNIEIILADAKDAIENSADSKEYDTIMKEYSIVNNLLLIRAIQDNPEKITKSYWYMQQGKGWYAPRKTRKKERRKYINDCCQEFIDYSIQKHKDNKTFEGYKNYSKKDTAELKKAARRLNYKASKILDKLSPSYKHLGKIESALNQLKSFEINTFDLYRRLSGETEARNTSNRINLSDAERLEKSPLETADVSETEQLVVFDDGSTAYSESNMSDDVQGNLFYDNITPKKLNSMNIKGSYLPAENLIELFKNADESTIVHEFAHWWLDRFVKYAKDNEEIAADLAEIRKFVKNDGGEFTREQHEKFARGFEAYIRSGYAKTNRLKKIFEDFKNALLAIYDSIKKLGFKDDDLPEIQGLFDRLLTTERERIKSTVFDKIAEIDAKIEDIKSNEENEFRQLDELWKTNLDILNRKSEKSRTVKEYLELADKMTSRETKEIKEFKQRYKEATLSILSTASGKPTSWVANKKNWEKLQELIADVADRITTHNGFHPEWSEFYSDTGVSYENDEIDGDYNLAQQAFEVMADGRYNRTFDENYEFDDIGKFLAKLDYLYGKIKTLKGQEKEAAFEAYGQLFETMPAMPDEVVASVAETMQKIADEYEEEQKTDFNRKILNKTDLIWQLQYFITKKLNDLKVYNPETRYKMRLSKSHRLYRYIQGIHSVDGAKKQVRRINEFVIDDMRNNQRSLLHKEIQRQIKVNSKVVKIGTIAKGKFDWKTNTIFSELVEMNKLTRQEAENQIGALIQIQDAAKSENRDSYDENETGEFEKTNDFQNNLKTKFLQYRSQKIQDLDVTHTMQLLQDILELKDAGRKAKSEQDFINKTQRWNTKNNLLDILEVTKNSGAKFGANWVAGVGRFASLNSGTLANWESLLNAIFDKDTSRKYSLLADEAKSDVYARNHMKYFYDRAAKIYGFKEANNWDRFLDYDYMQPMIKLFQEYSNETYTYTQSVFSINSPDGVARSNIEISRAQMITMFAWSLNDKLEQRLYTQFGLEQIRDMFDNKLSSQDRELAWALIDTCERMREDINEVFIRTTGLSLPAVQNYFPSKAERVQSDIDMYHDFFVKSSSPSFIKERKVCNRIPMKPLSPLEILIPHINKTAKYVVMSEKVNFLNQIFKDTAIKTKMQEIWGSKDGADIYQTLINKLAASTFTNYSKGTNLVAGALDTLSRNYITSSIGFSPKVALGQLLSVINYAENMPAHLWAKGFKDTLKHPVESFKYMIDNCEYLQSRLAGNSQNEVMAILTSEKDKFRTLRNFMTSNVKWGDIIAITLGGKAYVDYLMQQGMSKEEAFDKFVEDTMRAQQAGTTSSISEWQSAQAKNCLTRMFFAFRNTDMQYERKFIDTLIQAKKGEIPAKELIKKLFIYKIFNPFMFVSFLQNLSLVALFRGIFDDDQDEAIIGFLKSAIEAVMLSGMTAYGFAGFIAKSFMESIVAHFDKEYKHFETDVPVMGDIDMQVQKYLKGDLEFADYVEALALGSEFALGIPAQKIVNTSGGVGDLAQGNYGVGLSRIAGWGRYTSTKAWTGKEPEKKKKKKRN